MEVWKPIPSLPGYEASDAGRIRSVDRVVTDTRGRSYPVTGKVLALNLSPNGYLRFNTSSGAHAVHRCVLEAFVGPPPEGAHGAHGDGQKTNNAEGNLRWATPKENAADKRSHGTAYRPTGERHHAAKITDDMAAQIKRLHASGVMQSHISLITGVDRKTVNSIVRGKSWRHVAVPQSDMRAMGRVG